MECHQHGKPWEAPGMGAGNQLSHHCGMRGDVGRQESVTAGGADNVEYQQMAQVYAGVDNITDLYSMPRCV